MFCFIYWSLYAKNPLRVNIIKNYNLYIVTKERIIICTIIAQVIWYIYTPMNL